MAMEHKTSSETESKELAKKIASLIKPGTVIALTGDLGAGKTTFTQGFCQALNITAYVTSPTFTLINIYQGQVPIYHIDLYRLNQEEEAYDIGIEDYLPTSDGITILEWADKFPELLPDNCLSIKIDYESNSSRKFEIRYTRDFEHQLSILLSQA